MNQMILLLLPFREYTISGKMPKNLPLNETVESCLFRQALLWNLSKATALKKTVSFLNLATRKTGRKMLMDIFTAASIFIFELKDILEQYRNCFEISEIELWIEMPYSPPKTAALWIPPPVLECAKLSGCKKIVHNSFILNMSNKQV